MGVVQALFSGLFGNGRNVLSETAEVFRVNSEKEAARGAEARAASLGQFAAEFNHAKRGLFDRFVDGLNRLPRPAMALGTIGLIVSAMAAPDWFTPRMAGLAAVPDPLWWLMGAIVSFYFGARYQVKAQDFQRDVMRGAPPEKTKSKTVSQEAGASSIWHDNPALEEWRSSR